MLMTYLEHVTIVFVLVKLETDTGIVQVIRETTFLMHLLTVMMNINLRHVHRLNQTPDATLLMTGFGSIPY